MCPGQLLAWSTVGLLMGLPMAIWPYRIALLGEVLDAIGRKPSGRIEPADWNVALTRGIGIIASGWGLLSAGACLAG